MNQPGQTPTGETDLPAGTAANHETGFGNGDLSKQMVCQERLHSQSRPDNGKTPLQETDNNQHPGVDLFIEISGHLFQDQLQSQFLIFPKNCNCNFLADFILIKELL